MFSRGAPEPQYGPIRPRAPSSTARRVDGRARSTRRDELGAAARKDAARSSAAGRRSSRASGRARSPSRRTSPLAALVPVRAPPVAPRPLDRSGSSSGTTARPPPGSRSRPCTRSRGSRARRGAGLASPRTRAHGLVPGSGPPRSPARARRSRQRVSAARSTSRSVLLVPLDADRPLEQSEASRRRVCRASSAATKLLLSRAFSSCSGNLHRSPPNELELRRHRSMILHLTMATEASGSTCGWRAGHPAARRRAELLGLGEDRQETTRMEGVHA